jgi:hypothetical protein
MFTKRDLSDDLEAVRSAYAPDAIVLDCTEDFEMLDPAVAEELLLVTETVDPITLDPAWVPDGAPEILSQYAGSDLTIGLPGDGGVAWTAQTEPHCVFVKPRLAGSPESFVEFLIAEALVQTSLGVPEGILEFFGEYYAELASITDDSIDPAGTYQLAVGLYDAYLGLRTRPEFSDWDESHPALYDAWRDAGERLQPRLDDLSTEMARGRTEFPAAAELACSGIKHGLDLPTPFSPLDVAAYLEHGPEFAVQWAETTFAELSE